MEKYFASCVVCLIEWLSDLCDSNPATAATLPCAHARTQMYLRTYILNTYTFCCMYAHIVQGYKDSTQKIAMKLCDRVFQATEMPYWLDCDGGMSFGEEMAQEMREGVKNCKIVILMISDAFCNSGNCLFEFWNIVHNRKHVIPLLVPDAGPTSRFGPSGWTGQYQGKDWWKHAQDVFDFEKDAANHPHKDILKNPPWDYLEEFKPIDLRGETLQVVRYSTLQSPDAHTNAALRLTRH